ncbi:putative phage abortive infection protein [Mucilaginibacter defluvii]|uniref:Phage abortive infection protein n=1 Tax=Mucilaginibacter defluvii TaxID=1196019 RepID=A0ABP9G095_9SPHI
MAKVPNHQGKVTFEFILTQFETCIHDLRPFFQLFTYEKICLPAETAKIGCILKQRPDIKPLQLILCDIAYSVVFFGLNKWDREAIKNLYQSVYHPMFLKYVLDYLSRKPHRDSEEYNQWRELQFPLRTAYLEQLTANMAENADHLNVFSETLDRDSKFRHLSFSRPYKFYGGHQFKLGHYYRHLFQTVKYINEQSIFSYPEKYEYSKTLRAQLSTPEQYLLLFNSISRIGRDWELNKLVADATCIDEQLITKYNLVRNVPSVTFLDFLDMRDYYPLVTFEFQPEPEGRDKLEKKYH